jgi:hypothetical protein
MNNNRIATLLCCRSYAIFIDADTVSSLPLHFACFVTDAKADTDTLVSKGPEFE